MNIIDNTTTQPQLNAIGQLDTPSATMLAITSNRTKRAKHLLSNLLLEIRYSDEPRFTVEQSELLEKRFCGIRDALDGE